MIAKTAALLFDPARNPGADELTRLRTAVVALAELLIARGGATPAEIERALRQADLVGRASTMPCAACGQPVVVDQAVCAFCDVALPEVTDADAIPRPPPSGRTVRVKNGGDTPFLDGERVDVAIFDWENVKARIRGVRPATTMD